MQFVIFFAFLLSWVHASLTHPSKLSSLQTPASVDSSMLPSPQLRPAFLLRIDPDRIHTFLEKVVEWIKNRLLRRKPRRRSEKDFYGSEEADNSQDDKPLRHAGAI